MVINFRVVQFASFTHAVMGQLQLNGFLFSHILIDKKQTELLFLFAKTFKLDSYFFLRFCYGFDTRD